MTHTPEPGLHVHLAGRLKHELEVGRYAKKLFEWLGVEQTYELRILRKVTGAPESHGVVVTKFLRYGKVECRIQWGDNSTRFLCYLHSPQMTASSLLDLLRSRLTNYRWTTDELKPHAPKIVALPATADAPQLLAPTAPVLDIGKGRLSAYAQDPELRDFVITALREKFGESEFKSREFHKVIVSLAGQPAPTTQASGQLVRRYCELGSVTKTRMRGLTSYYRLVSVDEQLQKLRAVAGEIEHAAASLDEVKKKESACRVEIAQLKQQLQAAEDRLAEIGEEKTRLQAVIDDPVRKEARTKVTRIEQILQR
jgi:hypothetical protein